MPATRRRKQHSRGGGPHIPPLRLLGTLLLADARDDDEQIVALLVLSMSYKKLHSGRYGRRGRYDSQKSEDFLEVLLTRFSDRMFKAFCRMSREAFWHVHSLIQVDPIFLSTGSRPQRPVKYQLIAYLLKFGPATSLQTAGILAFAEGTVYNYAKRVCRALRNIRTRHLFWPGPARREFLKTKMAEFGFPGCIGIVDGTLIRLAEKPLVDGWAFYCRKKYYALLVQAVVDHRGIFTEYELGWPGSVADTAAFKESDIWQQKGKYFEDDEYILADKGYPLTKFTIRPFAEHDLTNDAAEASARRHWNRNLSHLRVRVEHAFGILKGRFPALRAFTGSDIEQMWMFVESLMILHNILQEFGDDPNEIEGFNGREDEDPAPPQEDEDVLVRGARGRDRLTEDELYQTGLIRRKRLLDLDRDL